MNCTDYREALSARIDGEDHDLPDGALDRHLATCAACRDFEAAATRLRRSLLVQPAPAVPDLTATVLAATPPLRAERWGLRVALGLVALAQAGLGLAALLGVDPGHTDAGAVHAGNESAAWNIALGIGLLWAALRPRAAAGQLPAFTGFVAILALVCAIDLATGEVTTVRVASHGFVVLGVALLYALHRQVRTTTPAPTPRATATTPSAPSSTTGGSMRRAPSPSRRMGLRHNPSAREDRIA